MTKNTRKKNLWKQWRKLWNNTRARPELTMDSGGSDHEDVNEHIKKVLEIVDLFHIPNITIDQMMLRAFSMSLTGTATYGLRNEPTGSIITWDGLKTKFLNKYCPPARTTKKMEEINNFQQEPDENLYQVWERFKELLIKCPQHYLSKMQEVIVFYNGLGIPTRQILDSRGAIPSKTDADTKIAIKEMAEYSLKWHNGISKSRSTKTSNGLAAIQAQLNNLGREIKKVNEKVYAAQVGCEQCKGPHYTKDFPLKEEGKTLEEAYYMKFSGPFQGGGFKATALGFYQRNNVNPSKSITGWMIQTLLWKNTSCSRKKMLKKHVKVFNWKTTKYGKIWFDKDIHDLISVETKFPAITFNDERHQYLRYEGLQYTDADILDFESRLTRIHRREVHRVWVFDFGGLPELMAEGLSTRMLMEHKDAQGVSMFTSWAWRRLFDIRGPRCMSWRQFILALGLHTDEEMQTTGFGAYWAESARQILDKGDLRDYWIGISSAGDFLGTVPSYTTIQDLILRLCHRLITCSITRRSQAPEKVVVRPERQQIAAAGAPEAVEDDPAVDEGGQAYPAPIQAPQQPPPPAVARTIPQILGRLEKEVQAFDGTFRGSSPVAF
nr:hypothetical protein [Tanacetum cinerariifolium]